MGAIANGVDAKDQNENAGCSVATLKGSWGFYRTGINAIGPYASIGIMFCDGNGNCKRRQAASFNGAFERNSLSFKYQIAADCTGKFLGVEGGEFAAFVIVDNGNEIYWLAENNQTVYSVTKKIHH